MHQASPHEFHPTALQCPQCGANLTPAAEAYVICQYCGSSVVIAHSAPDSRSQEAEVNAALGMRLKELRYTDREGTGLEMFRMLIPVGWDFRGGCRWALDNPGMPAVAAFQVWNPQGAEIFEVLPNMNFTWNTAPLTQMMFPPGSRYFGAEVHQPVNIQEAMFKFVLPRYRSQMQNLQVVDFSPQPDLPRLVKSEAAASGGWAEGGRVRIRYGWQGSAYEEDMYGVVEVFRAPMITMLAAAEVFFWFIDYLFSFRTAPGRMDAASKLFGVMAYSFRLNPHWYAAYQSIIQYLARQQIQRIHHIGQISQILAQTSREIREQNLQSWYHRQEVQDRQNLEWSRAMRGVEGFYDPHREQVVELPSGYGHAWANNLGEYIVTEDPNFNPNLFSNLHWEEMPQQS
ncbi:MAG: hypothetical protein HPY45_14125 [Anaerolineae bacterium]|nr:hypothetical protein [Anaerolineae bacterium]